MQRAGESSDDIRFRPGYREAKAKRYANMREVAGGGLNHTDPLQRRNAYRRSANSQIPPIRKVN